MKTDLQLLMLGYAKRFAASFVDQASSEFFKGVMYRRSSEQTRAAIA